MDIEGTILTVPKDEVRLCELCQAQGLRSRVSEIVSSTMTLEWREPPQTFWDEDGRKHVHDPRMYSRRFQCSNRHSWVEDNPRRCWCGFPEAK